MNGRILNRVVFLTAVVLLAIPLALAQTTESAPVREISAAPAIAPEPCSHAPHCGLGKEPRRDGA